LSLSSFGANNLSLVAGIRVQWISLKPTDIDQGLVGGNFLTFDTAGFQAARDRLAKQW